MQHPTQVSKMSQNVCTVIVSRWYVAVFV